MKYLVWFNNNKSQSLYTVLFSYKKCITVIWCKNLITFNLGIKWDAADSVLKIGVIMRLGCSWERRCLTGL